MDDDTRDQIRTAFAELTGLMEDAATVAVEGQCPETSAAEAMQLARSIEPLLNQASNCLRRIEALAAGQSPGGRP